MAKSTVNLKMTKNINLPSAPSVPKGARTLPHNKQVVCDESFTFSFSRFDREHELFNLGSGKGREPIEAAWFLDLFDCLKSVSSRTIPQLISSMHQLHPIDWKKTNTKPPDDNEQQEYWQFRINKSKGRVIGILTKGIFYVVWLDPHHNLTDSDGYGTAKYCPRPKSEYELLCEKCCEIDRENQELREILDIATAPHSNK